MSIHRPYLRALLVLLLVLLLDQLSKRLVSHSIVVGEEVKLLPGISLVDTHNRGVAFGLAAGSQLAVTLLVSVALLALLAYFLTHSSRPLIWLPVGLLLGGALGNLLDRLREGYVVDFVKLPLGWPPFNLADLSIVIGVLLLLLVIERPPAAPPAGPAAESAGPPAEPPTEPPIEPTAGPSGPSGPSGP
ncbi:MAG TPA: signal peptidase II [Solirubrobacteraceae bacterium]|nr:signal peptidase II [Solirubrobacteraceae bacterium]